MKAELLRQALALNAEGEAAVVVRGLEREFAVLVSARGVVGDSAGLPAGVLAQARKQCARDDTVVVEADGQRFLLQTLAPALRLIVVGAVHIAQKLIPIAQVVGFDVVLVDPRPAFATQERFPGATIISDWPQNVMAGLVLNSRTALVTLSHDAKIDEPALQAALASPAFYIGALGSQKNHTKRLARLAEHGFDAATLARIAGPIGLPLGGRSPAEIAVAIMAQIVQQRYASP
jgi:xanthine dehydrogenase accessory factor